MGHNEYIAYYRVSTKRQGSSGLGLEAQQAATSGYNVVESFTDIESGTKSTRPQLQAALAACKRTGAKLLIAKLDRLARNVLFIAQLMEANVDFVCVDMPEATKFTLHMMAAVAENEAGMISARTKAALAAAKARGTVLGKPENLSSEGRAKGAATMRQRAADTYAAILPMIKQLKAAGDSLATIAAKLNQTGQVNSRGNPYNPQMISRILARN